MAKWGEATPAYDQREEIYAAMKRKQELAQLGRPRTDNALRYQSGNPDSFLTVSVEEYRRLQAFKGFVIHLELNGVTNWPPYEATKERFFANRSRVEAEPI